MDLLECMKEKMLNDISHELLPYFPITYYNYICYLFSSLTMLTYQIHWGNREEIAKCSQNLPTYFLLVSLLLAFLDDPKFHGTFTGIHGMCVECACTLLNLVGKTIDMTPNEKVH